MTIRNSALLTCLLGCFASLLSTVSCSSSTAQTPSSVASAAVSVAVAKPEHGTANATLILTGTVVPFEQVTLYSQAAGYLRRLKVDIGDHVRAGELLAQIESPALRDELAQKQAALQNAQAGIQRTQANLEQAHAEAAYAQLTFDRLSGIRQRDEEVMAQQDVDEAKRNRDMTLAKQHIAEAEVQSSQAAVTGVKADMAGLHTQLGFSEIRSPLTGVVSERFVDPGTLIQVATASRTQAAPLLTVTRIDRLRIVFDVPEASSTKVKDGTPVQVRIADQLFKRAVTRLTGTLDPSTHTMRTEIDIENPHEQLRPGMTANVELELSSYGDALLVPVAAVHTDGTRHSVYIVRDGIAHSVEVRTGVETPDHIQITSGLNGDEEVIVAAGGFLKNGSKVQVSQ